MVRVIVLIALVACKKGGDAPPSPLQDGRATTTVSDAAPLFADAAIGKAKPTATKVAVSARAACALMSDATVRCWGKNDHGQLGDGTTKDSSVPVAPKLHGVKDLVMGDDHACALIDDRSVVCWGKIGVGKAAEQHEPVAASGVNDAIAIFALGGASCATEKSGPLVCWGDVDPRGHISTSGANHAPTPVPGVDHAIALTERAALRDDGDVVLWLDDGVPARAGVKGMIELAARGELACALGSDGVVTCFGAKQLCGPVKAAPKSKPKAKPKAKPKKGAKPAKPEPAPPPEPKTVAFTLTLPKAAHLAFDTGACVISTAKQLVCADVAKRCSPLRPWPALVTVDAMAGACGRLANGTVRCGVVGTPAAPLIANVAGATQIAATTTRGCALVTDGGVVCWDGTAPAQRVPL
jgi:hypothetical protein